MATVEIPKNYRHTCDCCGVQETNLDKTRPEYWLFISGEQRGISYAGKGFSKLLCKDCGEATLQAIERVEPKGK